MIRPRGAGVAHPERSRAATQLGAGTGTGPAQGPWPLYRIGGRVYLHDMTARHGSHGAHDHRGHAPHQHAPGSHGHAHEHERGGRRLTTALIVLASFTLVEAIGGYLANSIALLAEAAHMLADSASLLLAVIAVRAARRPADARRTYGHRRYQPLAAFINGQVLLLPTLCVVYEAV